MPFTITLSKTCICSFESRLIVRSILRSILKSISYYLMVRWFILFRAMLILWRRFLWGKSRGIFEFCFTYPRDTWCKIKRKSSKMLNVLKISIIITTHTATLNWHCPFFLSLHMQSSQQFIETTIKLTLRGYRLTWYWINLQNPFSFICYRM